MHRVIFMVLDAAVASWIMAPIFWIYYKKIFHDKTRTVLYFLFAIYLSGVFAVAGLPDIRYIRFNPRFNFVPFAYMFSDYTSTILNVALFVPMGVFLPLLWKSCLPFWKTLLLGLFASFSIEILQIFTLRATDINDLMTNTLGTFLGWIIIRLFLRHCKTSLKDAQRNDGFWVCITPLAVMFFIHPFL